LVASIKGAMLSNVIILHANLKNFYLFGTKFRMYAKESKLYP
jgi:hypothetical protein